METKTLSQPAIQVIDNYLHFNIGSAISSIPYFNNKTNRNRAALRTYIGKGSPEDIREEFNILIVKNNIDPKLFDNDSLKKFLIDNHLGIECSGFAYYVLDAECQYRGYGQIKKHISLKNKNLISKIRNTLRPAENCNVMTFADDNNSRVIPIKKVAPGDIITMINNTEMEMGEYNHILVIHKVLFKDSIPVKIFYSHSIAYPEDGVYSTGIRQGFIEISDINKNLTEAKWFEGSNEKSADYLLVKAQKSKTELRRLIWF